MQTPKVGYLDILKALISPQGILKGRVINTKGEKILIDFGSFVGEAKWEADVPYPSEGETVFVKVKKIGPPIVLKLIKKDKHIENNLFFNVNFSEEEALDDFSLLIKLMHTLSKNHTKPIREKAPVWEKIEEINKAQSGFEVFIVPVTIDESHRDEINFYIEKSEEKEREIFVLHILLNPPNMGQIRTDLYYNVKRGKTLIVNINTSTKQAQKVLNENKNQLEKVLKDLGFNPYIRVVYSPKNVMITAIGHKSTIEKRV